MVSYCEEIDGMSAPMLGVAITIVIAPDRARIGAQAVTDALVAIHNGRLTANHRKNIALRAHRRAGATANALCSIDVRVLGSWTFGEDFAFFRRVTRSQFTLLLGLEVSAQENECDSSGDQECD